MWALWAGQEERAVRDRIRWGGRILALLVIGAVVVYLWRVGLNRAAPIATVGGFLVAIVALVTPYLFPSEHNGTLRKRLAPNEVGATQPQAGGVPGVGKASTVAHAEALAARQMPAGHAGLSTAIAKSMPGGTARRPSKGDAEDALLRFSDIDDPAFRFQLLREMGDQLALGGPFQVAYHAMARDHVFAIVNAIWAFREPAQACQALVGAAERLRPHEAATVQLRGII
jgi:hypothetical protein